MTKRKFTKPTKFPAEYVNRNGDKAVILGKGPRKELPFIGHDADGYAASWTKKGKYYTDGTSGDDLHDIPKRISTWHNVYSDLLGSQLSSRREADGAYHSLKSGLDAVRQCVYRIERDEDGRNPEIFVEEV